MKSQQLAKAKRSWFVATGRHLRTGFLLHGDKKGQGNIVWVMAERDWERYQCTGEESAFMQLRDLANETCTCVGMVITDHTINVAKERRV